MTDNQDKAILAFALGPVQPFIEKARTVRDLWTGSYLISWLSAAAMHALSERLEQPVSEIILSPAVEGNLLLKTMRGELKPEEKRDATVPCSPHRFTALVPRDRAKELAKHCKDACQAEWERISKAVHSRLKEEWENLTEEGWDRDWNNQIKSCLNIQTAYLPLESGALDGLVEVSAAGWQPMEAIGRILEAQKSVRKPPDYQPEPDESGFYPPKCSLLGSFEQMGPGALKKSDAFWEAIAEVWRKGKGYRGSRIGKRDRFCAVSLVKRFAWPTYFSEERLNLNPTELRFSDTSTIAAREWLQTGEELDPEGIWKRDRYWSGQWLHWKSPNQDEEEDRCPTELWKQILSKRKKQGPPPTYLAVVVMDGDKMGDLFRGEPEKDWGHGRERIQKISQALSHFALHEVGKIVEDHAGELIYCGGDDVVALLPTRTVLKGVKAIQEAFSNRIQRQGVSAGIAIVHIKEDLRFSMRQARRAEGIAKGSGRNALTLAVCRRSGEHQTVSLGWDQVEALQQLVDQFTDPRGPAGQPGVSDRWAYKLREELPSLSGRSEKSGPEIPWEKREVPLPWDARTKEMDRLLERIEMKDQQRKRQFIRTVEELRSLYHAEGTEKRGWTEEDVLNGFVTLCQSASFLARGREE